MNNRKTKFLPPLRSIADFQTLQMMRDAINSLLNGRVNGNGSIDYSDSNWVLNLAAQTSQSSNIGPFSIYQPDKDVNDVFQIRPGLIGWRSPYLAGGSIDGTRSLYNSNYEMLVCGGGTDLYYSSFGVGIIDFSETTTNDAGIVELGAIPQIICETKVGTAYPAGVKIKVPAMTAGAQVSFWAVVIDDGTQPPWTRLYGYFVEGGFSYGGSGYFSGGPFPEISVYGPCFPVGIISLNGSGQPITISQFQYGHMTERYNPYHAGSVFELLNGLAPGGINYRGKMSLLTEAYSGYRIFFPGDVVIDDSAIKYFTVGGVGYYDTYVYCSNQIAAFDSSFNIDPTDPNPPLLTWEKIYFTPA